MAEQQTKIDIQQKSANETIELLKWIRENQYRQYACVLDSWTHREIVYGEQPYLTDKQLYDLWQQRKSQ